MNKIHKLLANKELISQEQYELLDAIDSNKVVSLYSELRLLLYLGVILFTGGVGYFVYENLGEVGHYLVMGIMLVAIGFCFVFVNKTAKPYSPNRILINNIYFDYVLLLGALLIAAFFTYIQVYFEWVELLLNYSSFVTAIVFFALAYRYDNKGVLALAITVFSAAVGLSVSPVDWAQGNFIAFENLYITSIIIGAALTVVGFFSEKFSIKEHFGFTYQNFGLILYYLGCLTGIFDTEYEIVYIFLTLSTGAYLLSYMWKKREFLLFIYSSIATYIALTYLLFTVLISNGDGIVLLIYYIPCSIIGYVIFLVNKKSHFSND